MKLNAFDIAYKTARKIVVGVIGGTLVLVGVVMLVTPGPAIVVIPAGLAVLALEFAWARRWLGVLRRRAGSAFKRRSRCENPRSETAKNNRQSG